MHPYDVVGVYYILNTITDRIYIGSSSRVVTRLQDHYSALKWHRHSCHALQHDYDTYGDASVDFGLITDITYRIPELEHSHHYDAERWWIKFYQADDPRYGYNRNRSASHMGGAGRRADPNAPRRGRLTDQDVADIRRRRATERGVDLAREYGVHESLICHIAKGRR